MMARKIISAVVLAVVVAGGSAYLYSRKEMSAQANVVTLYGNVDVRDVALGFRVSGRIAEMAALSPPQPELGGSPRAGAIGDGGGGGRRTRRPRARRTPGRVRSGSAGQVLGRVQRAGDRGGERPKRQSHRVAVDAGTGFCKRKCCQLV